MARTISARLGDLFTQGAEVVDTSFMGAHVLMLKNAGGDVRMGSTEVLRKPDAQAALSDRGGACARLSCFDRARRARHLAGAGGGRTLCGHAAVRRLRRHPHQPHLVHDGAGRLAAGVSDEQRVYLGTPSGDRGEEYIGPWSRINAGAGETLRIEPHDDARRARASGAPTPRPPGAARPQRAADRNAAGPCPRARSGRRRRAPDRAAHALPRHAAARRRQASVRPLRRRQARRCPRRLGGVGDHRGHHRCRLRYARRDLPRGLGRAARRRAAGSIG